MAMASMSAGDLRRELLAVTSDEDARAMVGRASRLAGAAEDAPLDLRQLLCVCDALAQQGGLVQRIAEEIAMRALRA